MRAVFDAKYCAKASESVSDSVTRKFRNPRASAVCAYEVMRSIEPGAILLIMSMPGVCMVIPPLRVCRHCFHLFHITCSQSPQLVTQRGLSHSMDTYGQQGQLNIARILGSW